MKKILLICAFIFLVLNINAQNIFESIKLGRSKELSEHFSQNVELVILNDDCICSKTHAEQLISKFFDAHKPEKFNIIYSFENGNSKYFVGILNTINNMNYRVYIVTSNFGQGEVIQIFRIEEANLLRR